jgi:hypothetical protein
MAKLTKRTVDAAKVGDKDNFIWDDDLPGLGLRVFASGNPRRADGEAPRSRKRAVIESFPKRVCAWRSAL